MTKQERLDGIRCQLDLLGYRADRLNPRSSPGYPRRRDRAPAYPVRPRLGLLNPQTARAAPYGAARPPQHGS